MDEFLAFSDDQQLPDQVKAQLRTKYTLQDPGPVKNILNWRVDRDWNAHTIKMSQPSYIDKIMDIYAAQDDKPAVTHYLSKQLQAATHKEDALDQTMYLYMHLIGHLRCIADSTRPDIAHITGLLGRYTSNPTINNWNAALCVLAFLSTTRSYGIAYCQLTAYSNNDYARCRDTRRSTTGYILTWNGGPVSWQSKRKKRVHVLHRKLTTQQHTTHPVKSASFEHYSQT